MGLGLEGMGISDTPITHFLDVVSSANCQFVPLTNRDILPTVFCLSLALGSPGIDTATTGVQGGGLRSSLHTAVHNYFWIPLPFLLKDP